MSGRQKAITPAVLRVFDVLAEAAARGEKCPGNDHLAVRAGCASTAWVADVVGLLEMRGLIQVWRYTCRRVVRIIATGHQTSGDTSAPQRVYGSGTRPPKGRGKTAPALPAGTLSPIVPLPGETVAQAIVRGADDAVVAAGGVVLRQPVGTSLRNLRGAIARHSLPPENREPAKGRMATVQRLAPRVILPARSCQWPLWADDAPRTERGLLCGDSVAYPGHPYCEHHRAVAVGRGTNAERRAEETLLAHAG